MAWNHVFEEIVFSDSKLQEIHIIAGDVTVNMTLWNEQRIAIKFADYVGLVDQGTVVAQIDSLKVAAASDFLQRTLAQANTQAPPGEYKHFRFMDSWSASPVLEIVARDAILYLENSIV